MSKVMHQMSAHAERAGVARGEALRDPVSDETQDTTHETEGTGSGLLLQALTRQNLLKAMKRVKANKGAAGVDGMDIDQTVEYLKHPWPRIRAALCKVKKTPFCSDRNKSQFTDLGFARSDAGKNTLRGIPNQVTGLL